MFQSVSLYAFINFFTAPNAEISFSSGLSFLLILTFVLFNTLLPFFQITPSGYNQFFVCQTWTAPSVPPQKSPSGFIHKTTCNALTCSPFEPFLRVSVKLYLSILSFTDLFVGLFVSFQDKVFFIDDQNHSIAFQINLKIFVFSFLYSVFVFFISASWPDNFAINSCLSTTPPHKAWKAFLASTLFCLDSFTLSFLKRAFSSFQSIFPVLLVSAISAILIASEWLITPVNKI